MLNRVAHTALRRMAAINQNLFGPSEADSTHIACGMKDESIWRFNLISAFKEKWID